LSLLFVREEEEGGKVWRGETREGGGGGVGMKKAEDSREGDVDPADEYEVE